MALLPCSSSFLSRLPPEIKENIFLELILADPFAFPKDLFRLKPTCKEFNHILSFSYVLWANAYKALFDTSAGARRLGPRGKRPRNMAYQLFTNYETLAWVRRGNFYSPQTCDMFWQILVLLLDNDGKNAIQLKAAGLLGIIYGFMDKRLYENADEGIFPLDNHINSLAVTILSMISDEDVLNSESRKQAQWIKALVAPFVFLPCRYPTAYLPNNHFHVPLSPSFESIFPESLETPHGPYPVYRSTTGDTIKTIYHMGCSFQFCAPLITIAAKRIDFARRDRLNPMFNLPHLPHIRSELSPEFAGPVREEVVEWYKQAAAKPARKSYRDWYERLGLPPSIEWDMTWEALDKWDPWIQEPMRPNHPPGALHGLWAGKLMLPSVRLYTEMITEDVCADRFHELVAETMIHPIYMRLREHHAVSPQLPVATGGRGDGFDDNLLSGYLPYGEALREEHGVLRVPDTTGQVHTYETYVPGQRNSHDEMTCRYCIERRDLDEERRACEDAEMSLPDSSSAYELDFASVGLGMPYRDNDCGGVDVVCERECRGVQDIIITGETDDRHSVAWEPYFYYGRIRPWDGLIAIVRVAYGPYAHLGRMVLTGYLVEGESILGTWRFGTPGIDMPGLEGAFSVSKVVER